MNTVTLNLTDAEVDTLAELLDQTDHRTCSYFGCQHLVSVRAKLSRLILAHHSDDN